MTAIQKNINLFAVFTKISSALLKVSKSIKFILGAGTFGAYAFMFTWKFALLIMLGIGIHEMGHVLAMRWFGLKTKGFYFIPFFGGAAISEEEFRSGYEEAWVALWGPIFGLGTVVISSSLYFITKDPMWAGVTTFLSTINLFNLFPINPLDGGRVVKTLMFSLGSVLGKGVLILGFILGIYLSFKFELGLLTFIAIIGLAELKPINYIVIVLLPAIIMCICISIWYVLCLKPDEIIPRCKKIIKYSKKIDLSNSHLEKKKGFWELNSLSRLKISSVFIVLISIFVISIFHLSDVPGADIAMKVLKDE